MDTNCRANSIIVIIYENAPSLLKIISPNEFEVSSQGQKSLLAFAANHHVTNRVIGEVKSTYRLFICKEKRSLEYHAALVKTTKIFNFFLRSRNEIGS
jgi:hypothetical protein